MKLLSDDAVDMGYAVSTGAQPHEPGTPPLSRLRRDHLQARDVVRRLATELCATAFYRDNHGDGALCWCGPEHGACYVVAETRDADCERKSKLLSEVGR